MSIAIAASESDQGMHWIYFRTYREHENTFAFWENVTEELVDGNHLRGGGYDMLPNGIG